MYAYGFTEKNSLAFNNNVCNKLLLETCWKNFGENIIVRDEGGSLGSASGDFEACQTICDETPGCNAFARHADATCHLKDKKFDGSEETYSKPPYTFYYRVCGE